MKRVEKSKKQLYETLNRHLETNKDHAWDITFLTFQELMNDLPTYGEKLEFVKFYNELLKSKSNSKKGGKKVASK